MKCKLVKINSNIFVLQTTKNGYNKASINIKHRRV